MAVLYAALAPGGRQAAKEGERKEFEQEHDKCFEAESASSSSGSSGGSSSSCLTSSGSGTSDSDSDSSGSGSAASAGGCDEAGIPGEEPGASARLPLVGALDQEEEAAEREQLADAEAHQEGACDGRPGGPAGEPARGGEPVSAVIAEVVEEEEVVVEEEEEEEEEAAVPHFLPLGEENHAALEKILEESEHMSQLSESLDEHADLLGAELALPRQPMTFPRPSVPTVISSFTSTSSSSVSVKPSLMSRSHELHFAGSTSSAGLGLPWESGRRERRNLSGAQAGTEIGWDRDAGVGAGDAAAAGGRRNLRHSGPMPLPSRPLYSPTPSPKHDAAFNDSDKNRTNVLRVGQFEEWAAKAGYGGVSREQARTPSPGRAFVPSPGRSFYPSGMISPGRSFNAGNAGVRGGKGEQSKSQLASLEEELSNLLRNRASTRRAAAAAAGGAGSHVVTHVPLLPAGRRGFSMELQRGSHYFGNSFSYARTGAADVKVEEACSDEEQDQGEDYGEDAMYEDAVYEESMRELEILVRAGSRMENNGTKLREGPVFALPPKVESSIKESNVSSSGSSPVSDVGQPEEKQVVHVAPPAQLENSGGVGRKGLAWAGLSKSGSLEGMMGSQHFGAQALKPLQGSGRDLKPSSTRLSGEVGAEAVGRKSPVGMSQRNGKQALKALGQDELALEEGGLYVPSAAAKNAGNLPSVSSPTPSTSSLKSFGKDVQALVSRVSWSYKKDMRRSRSMDDSAIPDKVLLFAAQDTKPVVAAVAIVLPKQDPVPVDASLRKISKQDSRESSLRKISKADSRQNSQRKLEALLNASFRKMEAEALASASAFGPKSCLDHNFPSFKTLSASSSGSASLNPHPEAAATASAQDEQQPSELEPSVVSSLEKVPVLRSRGSRHYYGSFADSDTDGAHIDLTASPAAKFLDTVKHPDDVSADLGRSLLHPFKVSAAVPFKWEDAPGKPKSPNISAKKPSGYSLQPPPRLQLPSGALSYSGGVSPVTRSGVQSRQGSGPLQEPDGRSPSEQQDLGTGCGFSIPASPSKPPRGSAASPKRHGKNGGTSSPDHKKGMSRLQSLLHAGCTLTDVAHLSHALRLPIPLSKDEMSRHSPNIDAMADGEPGSFSDSQTQNKIVVEDGYSPSSILAGPAEMSSSNSSMNLDSQRGKEDSVDHSGSERENISPTVDAPTQKNSLSNCFLRDREAEGAGLAGHQQQPSLKRNRSGRYDAGLLESTPPEEIGKSKPKSGQLNPESITNSASLKASSSRGSRSSRKLRVGSSRLSSGRLSSGRVPSGRTYEGPGSGSEWEEFPKSPRLGSQALSKRRKSEKAIVRLRRCPRFMITLKRLLRRAFCLGPKSKLGNSQRYSGSQAMYALTLN